MLGMAADGSDITVGVFRNNLAVGGTLLSNANGADDANNSWTLGGVTISDADFQSISEMGLDAPRQADGSLPVLANFRLAEGSDAIDRGVDVQLAFGGSSPDLGAFESGVVPPTVETPEGEAPGEDVPPATDPGEGPGDAPAAGDTPTFGLGGAQGTDDPGATDNGNAGPGASGSGPVAVAPPGVPGDDSSMMGQGDLGGGVGPNPSASEGCACTLPRDARNGVSSGLTAALLSLLGLRRRALRARHEDLTHVRAEVAAKRGSVRH